MKKEFDREEYEQKELRRYEARLGWSVYLRYRAIVCCVVLAITVVIAAVAFIVGLFDSDAEPIDPEATPSISITVEY